MSEIIAGRNAVAEALKAGREIEKVAIARGSEGAVKQIEAKAREKKIPIYYSDRARLDKQANGVNHQGIVAVASDYVYCDVDDIIDKAERLGEDPFILILDGLQDPHNLGAIIRTAECVGVHGIVIPKRRAVSVTETVAKTSAGAVEYMDCARVTNISATIARLQERGLWVCACDMGGEVYYEQNLTGPIAVVIGGEGSGVGRLVRERCDFAVSLPMRGQITSLNASNAAAVVMYEVFRQRNS